MRFTRRRCRLTGACAAAALVLAAGLGVACDIPIHKIAAEQWPREPYALFYCTQKGLKANAELDGLFKGAFRTWLESTNLDLIRIDVNKPMLQEDRDLMQQRGIHALPFAVLVDRNGKKVAERSGRLDAEAWKALQAAAKPAGPFKVVTFTRTRWGPAPTEAPAAPAATPFPVTVIDLDKADTEQRALSKRLGVVEYRLPHSVLLDTNGTKIAAHVGPLDARAWTRFQAAANPAGPCSVVAFTKTELGSPLADRTAASPLPVRVIDLDKGDKEARALAGRLNVVNLPFVSLVSPMGTELANFGSGLGEGHLRRAVASPKRTEIVKELEGKIAILLFIHSKNRKEDKKAMKAVTDGIKRGRRLFQGTIGLVEIDPTDNREEVLFRNLRLKRDGKEPLVLAVFGKGKVLAVPPMKGAFTSNDVLDVVQIVLQGCSCIIRPSDLGEDLLLDWPVPKERK